MIAKEQIIDLPVYKPGKPIDEVKKEFNLSKVIKLASNENPFGPSPRVRETIIKASTDLALYPDGAAQDIRHKLSDYYKLDGEYFILGNGSDNVIAMINRVYQTPRTNTVMATPTFPQYKTHAVIEGAEAIEVPLQEGVHDLDGMLARVNAQTRVVWICNPNNPSGTYVPEDALVAFMANIPEHVLVVLDEAYAEYVTASDYPDTLALCQQYPNLLLLRTFSKIYGLAALRIGYGIAQPNVVDLINRVREPFNTSTIAQRAAITALEDEAYKQECFQKNKAGKKQFYEAFTLMGYSYYPSEANFILVDIEQPANPIFDQLLGRGLIVRSGEALGFPTCLRITIGSEEDNQTIIDALTDILQGASA